MGYRNKGTLGVSFLQIATWKINGKRFIVSKDSELTADKIGFIFYSSVWFTAKLPPTCMSSPMINTSTRVVHLLQLMNLHRHVTITQNP